MMEPNTLETRLSRGELDATLKTLYGAGGMKSARERCTQVLERFRQTFDCPAEALFSAPGRTELGGNHTDHQHGRVLAAAVDLVEQFRQETEAALGKGAGHVVTIRPAGGVRIG